jgi:Glycine rich protein
MLHELDASNSRDPSDFSWWAGPRALTALLGLLAVSAAFAPGAATAQSFAYTGLEQVYSVPSGVTKVHVVVAGAPGGGPSGSGAIQGGLGALVSADLSIAPGQNVLYVEVGGTGAGFNGGGASNGGDASDVRLVSRAQPGSLNSRVIVAGGGGGAGGASGGDAGADGVGGSWAGKAGSASAGGAAGTASSGCSDNGTPGSLGQGGAAGPTGSAGGGGGGYYGGGGAGGGCGTNYEYVIGGGGGGSNYASPQALNASFGLDLSRTPEITITAQGPPSAVMLSALRVSPGKFALTGRLVGGRCRPLTGANHKRHPCRSPVALKIGYQLSAPTSVTFTIRQVLSGRLSGGRCTALTRANRHRRRCTLLRALPGRIVQAGTGGANSLVFAGRIGGRLLGLGSYQLTATPSSLNASGAPQTSLFQLLP